MQIDISDSAFNDLEDIKEYYEKKRIPHIGKQFLVSIIKHIQTLNDNPDIGRKVPEFNEEKIRELIHPPFRTVYVREQKSIHVVRIWRSERLLEKP